MDSLDRKVIKVIQVQLEGLESQAQQVFLVSLGPKVNVVSQDLEVSQE